MENRSLDNIIKSSLEDFEIKCTPQDWAFMEDMLNAELVEPIDETAKSKLQNTEVPFDATTWLAMESALDNLELEGIDEVAKSALEEVETPYNPDDWSIMEQKIEVELPNAVDELAKSALAEYAVPFVPLHWAIMDGQLDNAGFPHEVDEAAKIALQQFESAQPSNWAAMEASLVEVDNVRRQLIFTKSIELVLFVFAIWTIGNFLPFNHKSSNTAVPSIETVEQQDSKTIIPQANNNTESDLLENSEMNIASINNNNFVSESDLNKKNSTSNITETSSSDIDVLITNSEIINFENINSENTNTPLFIKNPVETLIKTAKEVKIEGFKPENEEILTAKPLAIIPTEELVTFGEDKKGPAFTLDKKKNQFSNTIIAASFVETKTPQLVLETPEGFMSSITTQYNTSPFHLKTSVSPQASTFIKHDKSQSAAGLATNLGIDYAISDNLEFSTGFAYNNKSYTYRDLEPFLNASNPKVVEINRSVKLDILQIPLRLNFNFRKNKKTRLYALVGITPGLIIKEDTKNGNASLINDVTAGTYRSIVDDSGNNDMFSNAEAGSSNTNKISARTFATTDVGLGLEYKTNTRFSFFIEPLFQRSLGGIGDENEIYKNYSLALGSRVVLK